MDDYRLPLPAPLLAYLRACRLKGMPKCTDLQDSSVEITITWSLAGPVSKQTSEKTEKRTTKPPQKSTKESPVKPGTLSMTSDAKRKGKSSESTTDKEYTVQAPSPMDTNMPPKPSPVKDQQLLPKKKKPAATSHTGEGHAANSNEAKYTSEDTPASSLQPTEPPLPTTDQTTRSDSSSGNDLNKARINLTSGARYKLSSRH